MALSRYLARPEETLIKGTPTVLARLRSSSFVRRAGILSGGTALGQAFIALASPIFSRMYTPRDFGRFALFTSFLSVMSVAVCLRYELSILSGRDETESAHLTLLSILLSLPVSVLGGAILWSLIHFSALGFGELAWYTPVIFAIAMCFVGIFSALRYWCLREEHFIQVSHGLVVQNAARAIFQVIFGAFGFHSGGLVMGETLGRTFGMSRMLRNAWPSLSRRLRTFGLQGFIQALRRHRKFPLYSLPSSLLDSICVSLPVLLLVRLFGSSVGGNYALVCAALTLPATLVTTAVADTFHSQVASCARENPDYILTLFRRTSVGLLMMGAIPVVVLWLWGIPLFKLVFGSEWGLSGAIAGVIGPWYLASFIVGPVSRVVFVLGGQEVKFIWDLACLFALLAVFYVAKYQQATPLTAIRLLTVANTVLYAVYYLFLFQIVTRSRTRRSGSAQVA